MVARMSGSNPVVRPSNSIPTLFWISLGVSGAILLGFWLVTAIFGEREIDYLGREPITASLNRFATASDLSGYCALEIWTLSDSSLDLLRQRSEAALAPANGFEEGFEPAEWRAIADIDAAVLPWNTRKCSDEDRRTFLSLAKGSAGFAAVMRRAREDGPAEHAVFLLALDEGVFARVVFSGETAEGLDPPGVEREAAPPLRP